MTRQPRSASPDAVSMRTIGSSSTSSTVPWSASASAASAAARSRIPSSTGFIG
jgi:hypothetical protein